MSAELRTDASKSLGRSSEANEIIILPYLNPPDLGKTEKESLQAPADPKPLASSTRPKKRAKDKVRKSPTRDSGSIDDSLDGNPLHGTTLE